MVFFFLALFEEKFQNFYFYFYHYQQPNRPAEDEKTGDSSAVTRWKILFADSDWTGSQSGYYFAIAEGPFPIA